MSSAFKQDLEDEIIKASLNKGPGPYLEDKVSVTPEMSRRSRTPRYMEMDSDVNSLCGAYSDSPDRGYYTPRSEGRKSVSSVHVDLSKKLKIQDPQRTPRIIPNNVLHLEMEPPSPRDVDSSQRKERTFCQSPEPDEDNVHSDSRQQNSPKESSSRKIDQRENKSRRNSPSISKSEKESSRSSNKSKKNTKNMKEKTHKKEFKRTDSRTSCSENSAVQGKREYKRVDSKSSITDAVVSKDKSWNKGIHKNNHKDTEPKRSKSVQKARSPSKITVDSKETLHYSDDFDESGDASDIEEGEFLKRNNE